MEVWECKQVIDFDNSTTTVKEERNQTLHQTKLSIHFLVRLHYSGTDPGFLIGGGADPPGGAYVQFAKFSQKMHGIEKILGRIRRREPGRPP